MKSDGLESWRELLEMHMRKVGESLPALVGNTMTDADMDDRFYPGFGSSSGCAFTAWTADRVYFPVVYDGAEWVGSAPRNPCGEATEHVGGQ